MFGFGLSSWAPEPLPPLSGFCFRRRRPCCCYCRRNASADISPLAPPGERSTSASARRRPSRNRRPAPAENGMGRGGIEVRFHAPSPPPPRRPDSAATATRPAREFGVRICRRRRRCAAAKRRGPTMLDKPYLQSAPGPSASATFRSSQAWILVNCAANQKPLTGAGQREAGGRGGAGPVQTEASGYGLHATKIGTYIHK